jgi:hypothetical protein
MAKQKTKLVMKAINNTAPIPGFSPKPQPDHFSQFWIMLACLG